jgi:phage tail sheath gpL-like
MANQLYTLGRQALADGGSIAWATDTIKAVLVDSGQYTANLATDANLSDIPAGARTATSAAFTGKTNVGGVFDAADIVFAAATGVQSEYVVIYKDTGAPTTSKLIALIDTATGLPVTPTGNDITVVWDNGANKIFKV